MKSEKSHRAGPRSSGVQFISEQQVKRLIDEGELLSPMSDSEKKQLPQLPDDDVERMIRIVDSIVEDPKFQRRLVDEIKQSSEPNKSVQTRPTSRPV